MQLEENIWNHLALTHHCFFPPSHSNSYHTLKFWICTLVAKTNICSFIHSWFCGCNSFWHFVFNIHVPSSFVLSSYLFPHLMIVVRTNFLTSLAWVTPSPNACLWDMFIIFHIHRTFFSSRRNIPVIFLLVFFLECPSLPSRTRQAASRRPCPQTSVFLRAEASSRFDGRGYTPPGRVG